jgi:hypothetical protein
MTDDAKKDVLLMIADISGYTEFMISNDLEIEHSQHIVSELIKTIITQINIPLEIAKLEGDAIFLYAVKRGGNYNWEDVRKTVGEKLMLFFEVFHEKITALQDSAACKCRVCSNIDALKLKIFVHSDEALFYSIQQFYELSGKDVILVHRLTKNSVNNDEYILMTESAYSDLEFPDQLTIEQGCEHYDHFGDIKTHVHYPQ